MLGVGNHFRGTWYCLEEDTCVDSGVGGSSASLPQDADRVRDYMSWNLGLRNRRARFKSCH